MTASPKDFPLVGKSGYLAHLELQISLQHVLQEPQFLEVGWQL